MSVVLITGCSRGFGLETALAFARNGDTVIATMRDPDGANALLTQATSEALELHVSKLDLLKSSEFGDVVKSIVDKHRRIDVLINNAGIRRSGALEDLSESDLRDVMETNCIGPLLLTKAVLPYMRSQRSGLIIMISSLSGIAGLPGDLSYAASKFALEGATEALRHEVDRWNIRVALVEAGLHNTGIMALDNSAGSVLPDNYPVDSPYRALIEWQLNEVRQQIRDASDPRDVAHLLVKIAATEKPQLRWPAGSQAAQVLATMFAQSDTERDKYLRNIARSDWWSQDSAPPFE